MEHGKTYNTLWWTVKTEDLAKTVFAVASDLINKQSGRYEEHRRHARLYGNYREMGLRALETEGLEYAPKVTMNVVASAIDTAQSRIAKSKPRPRFLTEGGDYGLKKQGQKLAKFIEGVYYDGNTYREARRSFIDASVFDIGAVKIVPKSFEASKGKKRKSIVHERVLSSELVFDPSDARYGRPSMVFQVQMINRFSLAEMFPSKRKEILQSGKDFNYSHDFMTTDMDGDSVTVIEGWKTKSQTSKKGRHFICISNAALLDEEWDSTLLPFEFLYFKDPMVGMFGEGIARKLTNNQLELNKMLRDIQLCIHLGAVPKVLIQDGTNIVDFHINNDIGGILKWTGSPPTSMELMRVPPDLWMGVDRLYQISLDEVGLSKLSISGEKPAELESGKALREYNDIGGIIKFKGSMPQQMELMRVPPDLWIHLEKLYQISLDEVGLSKLSISGEKPAELESGKALREYNDIESERFSIVAQNYEDFHTGLWRKTINMAKMYSLEDNSISVLAPTNKGMVRIDWKDVNLEEDKFMLQVFPTNFLSKTPSGKLADVQTLLNMGMVSPEEGMALLEFPDIEGLYRMKNAEFDAVDSIIENIVDKGQYEAPTLRIENMQWAIKRFTSMYYYYKNEGLELEKLELLDRWVSEALDLMGRVEQEAIQEQVAMQAGAMVDQGGNEGMPTLPEEQITTEALPNGI